MVKIPNSQAPDLQQDEIDDVAVAESGDLENRIRARAHQIWESEGMPDGREAEHWEQARREFEDAGESTDSEQRKADLVHKDAFAAAYGRG